MQHEQQQERHWDQLSDTEFLRRVEAAEIPGDGFRHRDHIRLAWQLLRSHPLEIAINRAVEIIRKFAEANGQPAKFHLTITKFWMLVVRQAMDAANGCDFDAFGAKYTYLLEKEYIFRFYSSDLLLSRLARSSWVQPDLMSLPGDTQGQEPFPAK